MEAVRRKIVSQFVLSLRTQSRFVSGFLIFDSLNFSKFLLALVPFISHSSKIPHHLLILFHVYFFTTSTLHPIPSTLLSKWLWSCAHPRLLRHSVPLRLSDVTGFGLDRSLRWSSPSRCRSLTAHISCTLLFLSVLLSLVSRVGARVS